MHEIKYIKKILNFLLTKLNKQLWILLFEKKYVY